MGNWQKLLILILVVMTMAVIVIPNIFAQSVADPTPEGSLIKVIPMNTEGTEIKVGVILFNVSQGTSTAVPERGAEQLVTDCRARYGRNWQTCVQDRSLENIRTSTGHLIQWNDIRSLQGADLVFEYYNVMAGRYERINNPSTGCSGPTNNREDINIPSGSGQTQFIFYYTLCRIPSSVFTSTITNRTNIRITFIPPASQNIQASTIIYPINNARVTADDGGFTNYFNSFLTGVAQGSSGVGVALPCVGIFLILGLFMASMYFSGRSPLSLLDITTPRLPAPKGVVAGGQVLLPFGYTELKAVTRNRMTEAARASTLIAGAMAAGMQRNMDYQALSEAARKAKGTLADTFAGDVGQQRQILQSALALGTTLGYNRTRLESLAQALPYNYTAEQFRLVWELIERGKQQGGRARILAMTLETYLSAMRQYMTLEANTGHALFKRSAPYYMVTNYLGRAIGYNRFPVVATMSLTGLDSFVRSTSIVFRGPAAVRKFGPVALRSVAQETIKAVGGERALKAVRDAQLRSRVARAIFAPPPKGEERPAGHAFRADMRMALLYKNLRDASYRDSMIYVLRQLYRSAGVRFDHIDLREMLRLGYAPADILASINYQKSAKLEAIENEIKGVFNNPLLTTNKQKLDALIEFAKTRAHVDQRVISFAERIYDIDTTNNDIHPEYARAILIKQAIDEQHKARSAISQGARREEAYLCTIGGEIPQQRMFSQMALLPLLHGLENHTTNLDEVRIGELLKYHVFGTMLELNHLVLAHPTSTPRELLPEMVRREDLQAKERQIRDIWAEMFTKKGMAEYQRTTSKTLYDSSIAEIVKYVTTGFAGEKRLAEKTFARKDQLKIDLQRQWNYSYDPGKLIDVITHTEAMFRLGRQSIYNASVEAEINAMPGAKSQSPQWRANMSKQLLMEQGLLRTLEDRANSLFEMNAYGRMSDEATRFAIGTSAGFLAQILRERGIDKTHPDRRIVEELDLNDPKQLKQFHDILIRYRPEYEEMMARSFTRSAIKNADVAIVQYGEGQYGYYHKALVVGDTEKFPNADMAIYDSKGIPQTFRPHDVIIQFKGRDDLYLEWEKVSQSKDPRDWTPFLKAVEGWARPGRYDSDREKILAAVVWHYGTQTGDNLTFWDKTAVVMLPRKQIIPATPASLAMFGMETPKLNERLKSIKAAGRELGEATVAIMQYMGGDVLKTSYEGALTWEYHRQKMAQYHTEILSGRADAYLTPEERKAARALAYGYTISAVTGDWTWDRNPVKASSAPGLEQAQQSLFMMGPMNVFKREQYGVAGTPHHSLSHRIFYMWPFALTRKMMEPISMAFRNAQELGTGGYGSVLEQTGNPLRPYYSPEGSMIAATRALNPFSYKYGSGRVSNWMYKIFGPWAAGPEEYGLGSLRLYGQKGRTSLQSWTRVANSFAEGRDEWSNPGQSMITFGGQHRLVSTMSSHAIGYQDPVLMHDPYIQQTAAEITLRRNISPFAKQARLAQQFQQFSVLGPFGIGGPGSSPNPHGAFGGAIGAAWQGTGLAVIVPQIITSLRTGRGGTGILRGIGRGMTQRVRGLAAETAPKAFVTVKRCGKCGKTNFVTGPSTCSCGAIIYL